MAVLGANVYAIAVVWPAQLGDVGWLSVLPALPLVAGIALLRGAAPEGATPGHFSTSIPRTLLLAVFPGLIAVAIATRPGSLTERAFGPLPLALLVLSLTAYGAFVAAFRKRELPVRALINNAGAICDDAVAVNHVGHMALCVGLLDALVAGGATIVNVAS